MVELKYCCFVIRANGADPDRLNIDFFKKEFCKSRCVFYGRFYVLNYFLSGRKSVIEFNNKWMGFGKLYYFPIGT
jgi:hypothetical protein